MAYTDFTTTTGAQEGCEQLNGRFANDVGHVHDGSARNGGIIDINSIKQSNLTKAIHGANPVPLTSVAGVLTLLETSNSFVANGSEAITSITGWSSGIAKITWNTARTLTNSANLALQGGVNRVTAVGDEGIYEFRGGNVVKEVGYFPATIQAVGSEVLGLTNFIANGMEVTAGTGLQVNVNPGRASISEKTQILTAVTPLTLNPRMANLVYAKQGANSIPEIGKIDAVYPEPDNNTVGQWRFNLNGDMPVPNYAVGKSSIAVANDLLPNGGLARVDGWCDYAVKGDGSTGYFASANTTGFPTTGEQEIELKFRYTTMATTQMLLTISSSGGAGAIGLSTDSAGLGSLLYSNQAASTGFIFENGKEYLATFYYDGVGRKGLKINGVTVYDYAEATAIIPQVFRVCSYYTTTNCSKCVIDYIEIRNKMRTPQQIAQISNNLLLPNFYNKPTAVYPSVLTSDLTTYHEYRFDESSGTSVADSNTTAPMTGVATGTTIVTSDIGLGNARKFNGTSDGLTGATTAMPKSLTVIAMAKTSASDTYRYLMACFAGANGFGVVTSNNGDGCFGIRSGGTIYSSGVQSPLNKSTFYAVSMNNLTASFYVDSPNIASTVTVTADYSSYSGTLTIGSGGASGTNFSGTIDYLIIIPRALTQAEIAQYYSALMSTGRRSIIDDVLPTNCISLGYARTNSTSMMEVDNTSYKYGIRQGATGGNRRVFLGWKYFNCSSNITWNNVPFGMQKYKVYFVGASDANGTNETAMPSLFYVGASSNYGTFVVTQTSSKIVAYNTSMNGLFQINGTWQTTGYIGCYAEVIE